MGPDVSDPVPAADEFWDPSAENLVDQISTKEPYQLNRTGSIKIAVLDFGAKANILRSLVRRDAAVTVLPWNYDFNAVRDEFDGLFLTNGPGDQSMTSLPVEFKITVTKYADMPFNIIHDIYNNEPRCSVSRHRRHKHQR